jgi:ATP-dependent Clp protease ATP-binding subunit ClpC
MTSNLGAKAIQNPEKFSSNKEVTTEQTNSDSEINNQNDSDSTINNEDDFDLFTNTDNENDELEKDDSERVEENRIKELVHEELKGFFKPEFLNRIDEIVVFQKLNRSDIREIAAIMLLNLKERLLSKSYNLIINETAINQIIDEGFNPDYGARPLRRVITNRLEDNLAATILEQRIEPGSTILIEYINSEFVITHNNYNETKDYLSSSI